MGVRIGNLHVAVQSHAVVHRLKVAAAVDEHRCQRVGDEAGRHLEQAGRCDTRLKRAFRYLLAPGHSATYAEIMQDLKPTEHQLTGILSRQTLSLGERPIHGRFLHNGCGY